MFCSKKLVFFFLCFLGIHGKPSLSFNLPSFGILSGLGNIREQREANFKPYSGMRVQNDSLRMVYFHEQTVAVVELGPKKLLLNCELIEAYAPEDAIKALESLQYISRPLSITFNEMIVLMDQCQQIDATIPAFTSKPDISNTNTGKGFLNNNPFTLLSGIIPGTKWCGTRDIAENYHDLGAEATSDRCCRTHDLCPVKISGNSRRYNLTNTSIYSKSHCQCDDNLFLCLKTVDSPTARLLGHMYFNIIQVPCIEDTKNGRKFKAANTTF